MIRCRVCNRFANPGRGAGRPIAYAVALALGLLLNPAVRSQPPMPPPPAHFKVELRYRIDAPRDQHVAQYREMLAGLKKLGFVFDPPLEDLSPTDPENLAKNTIEGRVPGKNAPQLRLVPYVESVLLIPANFKLPPQAGRVQVQLELASGFSPPAQQVFARQTTALLRRYGFQETVGYDHHGFTGLSYTRLRGTIGADQLEILVKDMRTQPTGWFAPKVRRSDLPMPFREANPIRIVQVLPDVAPVQPLQLPPGRDEERFEIIAPDLWEAIQPKGPGTRPLRIEILLAFTPAERDDAWQVEVRRTAPDLFVEGVLGNIVIGVFGHPYVDATGQLAAAPVLAADQVRALSSLPFVSVLRLPRPAGGQVDPAVQFAADNILALKQSGLAKLHKQKHRGQGMRLVIVDSDFRGYREARDQDKLPKDTRLVDLTIERNANLKPDPITGPPAALGHGTQCALAAALAAPEATILLVRIDPAAPYMLANVLHYIRGDVIFSPSLLRHYDEITEATKIMDSRRQKLMVERKVVVDTFDDEVEEIEHFKILGPVRPWLFTRREWHNLRLQEFEADHRQLKFAQVALAGHLAGLRALKGAEIVAFPLVWNDGYALGGRSPITRLLDAEVWPRKLPTLLAGPVPLPGRKGFPSPMWFTAAGNTRGQSWHGLFRDDDANGVMEFAGPEDRIPLGIWTNELNFLAWLPYAKEKFAELPPQTTFRVSLQWTEQHHPDYFLRPGEKDWYRRPLAEIKIVILRQRDPDAKVLPGDDFEVVAESYGLPQRLDNEPRSATYEINATWTTTRPGPYAVRIERRRPTQWLVDMHPESGNLQFILIHSLTPTGIRPLGVPTLQALEEHWEFKPRIFVDIVGGPGMGHGRPIFRDFYTEAGSVGVPADGHQVFTIGAARFDNKAEIFSALGPPARLDLFLTPRFFAYDRLAAGDKGTGPAYGTSLATAFAAGLAASVSGPRVERDAFFRWLQDFSKKRVLRVPE